MPRGGCPAANTANRASLNRVASGLKWAGVGHGGSMRRNAFFNLPAYRCMSANEWTSNLTAGPVTHPRVLGDQTAGTALMLNRCGTIARKANFSLVQPRG